MINSRVMILHCSCSIDASLRIQLPLSHNQRSSESNILHDIIITLFYLLTYRVAQKERKSNDHEFHVLVENIWWDICVNYCLYTVVLWWNYFLNVFFPLLFLHRQRAHFAFNKFDQRLTVLFNKNSFRWISNVHHTHAKKIPWEAEIVPKDKRKCFKKIFWQKHYNDKACLTHCW